MGAAWLGIVLGLAAGPSADVAGPADGGADYALVELHTSVDHVEDVEVAGDEVWVATRGGLEIYDADGSAVLRRYDTRDGLDVAHVWSVDVGARPIQVRTTGSQCRLEGTRFVCEAASGAPPMEPTVGPRRGGARVTAIATADETRFEGTAGQGLWLGGDAPRRLSAEDRVCSNHLSALRVDGDRMWLGSFHEGLCFTDDGRTFTAVEDSPRMINDLLVVDGVLFVAATEGLFRSEDGAGFERVAAIKPRGVNGLAHDGDTLVATTPGALWRVPLGRGRTTAHARPGGTRAVQGLVQTVDALWLPTEDRGIVRVNDTGETRRFDLAAGLPSSWVLAAAADSKGRIYAGSLRDGVTVIEPDGSHHALAGLPDAWIFEVARVGDRIGIGTQGGAAIVDGDAVTTLPDLPHPNVHAFAEYDGHLWVATEGGLAQYERLP